MTNVAVVYFSGYGHTKRIAEHVAEGADAQLIAIDQEGHLQDADWDTLSSAQGIIFGSPTYMGNVPWQFKKFAEATSKVWVARAWQDKVFGGFVNSASLNGDKQNTLIALQTLAAQHGGIWVSLGMLPANTQASTRDEVNNLGGSGGALIQSPSDAGADAIPAGDLETARQYGARVAGIARRLAR